MMVGQIHEFVHQVWLIEITSQWTKLLVGRKALTLESRRDISVTIFSYTNAIIGKAIVKSQPKAERSEYPSVPPENSYSNSENKEEQKAQEVDL